MILIFFVDLFDHFLVLQIDQGLKGVDKAYENFNLTLHRFDCMLAVDTASATRPFSPNGSCTDCKVRKIFLYCTEIS